MPQKKHVKPKLRKPIVVFCELRRPPDEIVNISSQNGAESVVSRMLPKSHVSHVILNANVSEERFLDMKVYFAYFINHKLKFLLIIKFIHGKYIRALAEFYSTDFIE